MRFQTKAKPLLIALPSDLYERIKGQAARDSISMAALLRLATIRYLEQFERGQDDGAQAA